MTKKFQRALFSTLAAFIIIPAASVSASETDTIDTNIVSEYDDSTPVNNPDYNKDTEEYDFTPVNIKNKAAKKQDFLDKTSDTILVDETSSFTLSNVPSDYSVSFKSSDESKLSINELSRLTCEYKGKTAGTAYITIKLKEPGLFFMAETITIKYKVTISPRAVSIKFNKGQYSLSEGDSLKLKLTVRPSISKEQPEFEVSNPKIISINSKAKVHGKNEGFAYVTATISNGKSAKCKVVVKK